MLVPPLPDLDALSLDELKKLASGGMDKATERDKSTTARCR
jgi:hypothetical protein